MHSPSNIRVLFQPALVPDDRDAKGHLSLCVPSTVVQLHSISYDLTRAFIHFTDSFKPKTAGIQIEYPRFRNKKAVRSSSQPKILILF